jgi:hypothetical protein
MTAGSLGAQLKNLLRRDYPPPGSPPTYRDAVLAAYGVATVAVSAITGLLTHRYDSVAATLLVGVGLLRTYSLYRSVAWIWKRGWTFRQRWEALTDTQRDEILAESPAGQRRLYRLYRDTGGLFIPFGVRGLIAWRWYSNGVGMSRRLRQQFYRLWKFYIFTIIWSAAVCALAYCDRGASGYARTTATVAAVLVMLGCISIGIEAALSYLILGGWSLSYHQLNVQVSQKVTELAAFAGGALALLLGVQAAVAFTARQDHAFRGIPPRMPIAAQIGRSFYYTSTMLTGNGDPDPVGYAGHLVAGIAFAASILFLVIVISLLFDAIAR